MKSLDKTLIKGLHSIEFITLCLIFISNLLFTSAITGDEKIVIKGNNIILSIVSLAFISLVIYLCNKIMGKSKTTCFLIISQLIYGVILLLWINTSTVVPFADQASVYKAALNFNLKNYQDFTKGGYLYQYNHQIPLTFMFSIFLKLFGSNYKILQIIIGACSIGVNLGLYKLTKEISSEKSAKIAVIISMIFVPTIMLTTYVYGDIIGLCFSIWAIYFTIRFGREGKIQYIIYSSILIGIAMLFRYNTIIVLAAMAIYLLLNTHPKKLLAVLIILTSLGYGYGIKEYVSFRTGSNLDGGVPSILYVNMGLEEGPRANGWYNNSTLKNYNSVDRDSSQANELGFKLVKDRLSYMSAHTLYTIKFFSTKFITTWTEPTYESLFFTLPHKQIREVTDYYTNNTFLSSLYYGSLNKYILLYCKGFVLFILIGSVLSSYINRKKPSLDCVFLLLSVVGTLIFHTFWETKSRYVFPAFALLFPLAASFLADKMDYLLSSRISIKNKMNLKDMSTLD